MACLNSILWIQECSKAPSVLLNFVNRTVTLLRGVRNKQRTASSNAPHTLCRASSPLLLQVLEQLCRR